MTLILMRIVTDSKLPGEPKDPESTSLTQIFDAFASDEASRAFREELKSGLGWGEAKKRLVEQIEAEIGPMREKYAYYTTHTEELEEILQAGAAKARKISAPFMERLREAVGLRRFHAISSSRKETVSEVKKNALPASFKQYREADGLFYFKLALPSGEVLLTSIGFVSGREAGQTVGMLKNSCSLEGLADKVILAENVSGDDVQAALREMKAEQERKAAQKAAQKSSC